MALRNWHRLCNNYLIMSTSLTAEVLYMEGGGSAPRGFLVFLFIDTSSASSSTRFMYSSNPCKENDSLRRLTGTVTDLIRFERRVAAELRGA